ncbi:MAG: PKD domain-containing protein [Bacteroidetes bacterium]|nr:PKD domain-containing protein [Bacteroidota bacterium]
MQKHFLRLLICGLFLPSLVFAQPCDPVLQSPSTTPMSICSGQNAFFLLQNWPGAGYQAHWDFGDGNTQVATEMFVNHFYFAPGNYSAQVRYRDIGNNCYSAYFPVNVTVYPYPNAPEVNTPVRCGSGEITFTPMTNPPAYHAYQWSQDGASTWVELPVFTTSVALGNPREVYVRTINTLMGCVSGSMPYYGYAEECSPSDPYSSALVAGTGAAGLNDGPGNEATFFGIQGITYDSDGNRLLLADAFNHRIRYIDLGSYEAGSISGSGMPGFEDGEGMGASFNYPAAIAYDPATGSIYVADKGNHAIRKIHNNYITTVAGTGGAGYQDGSLEEATFRNPTGLALLNSKLYVVDHGNHCIRVIDFNEETVGTLAGNGLPGYNNEQGLSARFNSPWGITAYDGQLYVTDYGNHAIREVNPEGYVSTLAGGTAGFEDGNTSIAQLNHPTGIYGNSGSLYFTDHGNRCVRKLNSGNVYTLSGNGTPGTIIGAQSTYLSPMGITGTGSSLYVIDAFGHHVRTLVSP